MVVIRNGVDTTNVCPGDGAAVRRALGVALDLTLLEAASAGLPIVATRVGGNVEIVADGESGFLVPVGAPCAFAEALEALARRADRRQMGARGRADVVARYDVGKMVAAYDTLYAEVLRLA